jgi:pyruvate,water dikinase
MRAYVLGFQEVGRTDVGVVGGKGANLGELSRLAGIRVPDGFCVSTEAFKRVLGAAPGIGGLLDRLALLKVEDREAIREVAAAIRGAIEGTAIPEDVREAIACFLARLGEQEAYAVRSSATAEDLPAASFAGQQDTYLNVIGKPAIVKHISRCWGRRLQGLLGGLLGGDEEERVAS